MAEPIPIRQAASSGALAEDLFASTLADSIAALERAAIGYAVIGGVGSAALGRPRWTRDIDIMVAPLDAGPALESLARMGFATERTNEHWIFKAEKNGLVVDLIFRTVGDIYLDEPMLRRSLRKDFLGVEMAVASPEDQIVIKAIAHDEQSARHWNDALALVASCSIDWTYLLERACRGPRRVLSLLVYAQSSDLVVPNWVIEELFESIFAEDETP